MTYHAAIIHMSDVECGTDNRAESEAREDGYRTCAERLIEDAGEILKRHGIASHRVGLVVTGDIASRGAGEEFDKAFGLLSHIRDSLSIAASHIAVVPGNHDVNWAACENAFKRQWPHLDPRDSNARARARSMEAKLAEFSAFLGRMTEATFEGPETVLSFDGLAELGFAAIGLDTTFPSTFADADNYGLLRDGAANRAREALLRMVEKDPNLVPIALMHHCPNPLADQTEDPSYLHHATEAMEWLKEGGFSVVLCGHEHQQRSVANLRTGGQVFATGSFGLNSKVLANRYHGEWRVESNRYQIVLVCPDGAGLVLLRKLSRPGSVDSNWVPDDDYGPSQVPIYLKRPRVEGEDPAAEVGVLVGQPVSLASGKGWVLSAVLTGSTAAMRTVGTVTYRIGDEEITRSASDEAFRGELEFARPDGAYLKIGVRFRDGRHSEFERKIPEPLS